MAYKVAVHDKGKFCDWIRPDPDDFKLMCCDCGLIHRFEFIVKRGVIFFRLTRHNRATAARRRNPKVKAKMKLIAHKGR